MQRVNSKSFFKEMISLKKMIEAKRDKELGSIYLDLERYVLDCSYSSYKYSPTISRMLLDGRSSEEIGQTLGISDSTVRYHESTSLSKKLYAIFGKDFFRLIRDYESNKREVDRRIFLALRSNTDRYSYCMSDVIKEVRNKLPLAVAETTDYFNIVDCGKELAFLSKYSLSNMERDIKDLDLFKLEYLMKILDGERGTVDERFNFVCRIEKS